MAIATKTRTVKVLLSANKGTQAIWLRAAVEVKQAFQVSIYRNGEIFQSVRESGANIFHSSSLLQTLTIASTPTPVLGEDLLRLAPRHLLRLHQFRDLCQHSCIPTAVRQLHNVENASATVTVTVIASAQWFARTEMVANLFQAAVDLMIQVSTSMGYGKWKFFYVNIVPNAPDFSLYLLQELISVLTRSWSGTIVPCCPFSFLIYKLISSHVDLSHILC